MVDWLKDAVFYEIYPQSFYDTNDDGIGDIPGIIEKLAYIKGLGCNAIWINPSFDSPFQDAGYDVRNYKQVAARYGTNEDLYHLFQKAHNLGMHVLLDLVPGHTSHRHPWFLLSQRARKNRYTDRYIWTDSIWTRSSTLSSISGLSERDGCYCLNFFASQPALNYGFYNVTAPWQMSYTNQECIETRDAIKDVMHFWLSHGCDGFRVDMAGSLVKQDPEAKGTAEVWRYIFSDLRKQFPQMVCVAEWCNPPKAINLAGFDMDFYLHRPGNGISSLLRLFDKEGKDKSFFSQQGNGDIKLFLQEYLPWYQATKEKGYICFPTGNHDTDRLTKHLTTNEIKLAFAFLFTMPGIPFLYYGDEIGMRYLSLVSKEGGYKRTGSRTPMQWNHLKKNLGFSDAPSRQLYLPVDSGDFAPCVDLEEENKDSLLHVLRKVLRLRHQIEDLSSKPNFEVVYAKERAFPFVYKRGKYALAINPSDTDVQVEIPFACGDSLFSINESHVKNKILSMSSQSFVIYPII